MKTLSHPILNRTKNVPTGISLTAIFFGCFVPLFRGDFKWGAISFGVCIAGFFLFFIPTIVMWVWLIARYNDAYLLDLIAQGWVIQEAQ